MASTGNANANPFAKKAKGKKKKGKKLPPWLEKKETMPKKKKGGK